MKKVLASVITIIFITFLLTAVREMPKFADESSPVNNEVSNRYITKSMEEVGAINIVSSMILDYRAFDTFVETSVIFTSLIAVTAVMKKGDRGDED